MSFDGAGGLGGKELLGDVGEGADGGIAGRLVPHQRASRRRQPVQRPVGDVRVHAVAGHRRDRGVHHLAVGDQVRQLDLVADRAAAPDRAASGCAGGGQRVQAD
jgi:hypothetical protein